MKMVIVMRTDLGISPGKAIAQGAHAAIGTCRLRPHLTDIWFGVGQKKIILAVTSSVALLALRDRALEIDLPHYMVEDSGLTEVEPGTPTALGLGPATDTEIDEITGELNLYRRARGKPLKADEIDKLREAVGLLNSMVYCGEKHSAVSEAIVAEARAILGRREVPEGTDASARATRPGQLPGRRQPWGGRRDRPRR